MSVPNQFPIPALEFAVKRGAIVAGNFGKFVETLLLLEQITEILLFSLKACGVSGWVIFHKAQWLCVSGFALL